MTTLQKNGLTPAMGAAAGQVWRRIAGPALWVAIIVGLLVGGSTAAASALSEPKYEARIGVLAVPAGDDLAVASSFGAVVSLSMAAIAEAAHSPGLLEQVRAAVPNAPELDELDQVIGVVQVPGSGMTRISITDSSAEQATALVVALNDALQRADLLSPVGKLRLVGGVPTLIEVSPDIKMSIGFGIVTGVIAAAAAFGLMRLYWPPREVALRSVLKTARVTKPVALLSQSIDDVPARIAALSSAAGKPVRVVSPAGHSEGTAELTKVLRGAGVSVVEDAGTPSITVIADGGGSTHELAVLMSTAGVDSIVAIVQR